MWRGVVWNGEMTAAVKVKNDKFKEFPRVRVAFFSGILYVVNSLGQVSSAVH